eukprot:1153611-Amphidinium_carterae.1
MTPEVARQLLLPRRITEQGGRVECWSIESLSATTLSVRITTPPCCSGPVAWRSQSRAAIGVIPSQGKQKRVAPQPEGAHSCRCIVHHPQEQNALQITLPFPSTSKLR